MEKCSTWAVNSDIALSSSLISEPHAVQIISANRLADGIVVYAAGNGAWVKQLSEARIFASKAEADAGLTAAQNDAKRNLVVEPCLVEVKENGGSVLPVTLREAIRAQGPTVDFLPRRRVLGQGGRPMPEQAAQLEKVAVLRVPPREDAAVHGVRERSIRTA
jgi:hypothetical protein